MSPHVPDPEQLLEGHAERDQWMLYDDESPIHPRKPCGWNGSIDHSASWKDPADWLSLDEALEAAQTRPSYGVGYRFVEADPFIAIDIDGCLREDTDDPKPAEWFQALSLAPFIDAGAHIDVSPSGTGLRIIIRDADVPSWWQDVSDDDADHVGIEVINDSFATITGNSLHGHEADGGSMSTETLEEWLREAWDVFEDEPPETAHRSERAALDTDTATATNARADVDLSVYDVISSANYPEEERVGHPFHPSGTDANFKVDDGGETWRCWRHDCTGNAAHLLGLEAGILDCGEWTTRAIDSRTWRDVFDYAREKGYDIPEPVRAQPDGGAAVSTPTAEFGEQPGGDGDNTRTLRERVQDIVLAYEADDDMAQRAVIHRAALAIIDEYDFVHPPENADAWRSVLYRYDETEGVYVPDGERFVEELGETLLGEFLTNKQTNELVGKIKRRSGVDVDELDTEPHRLVVGNGILNLRTGDLDPWTPDEYHRTKVDVEWPDDPESAECPRIDEFFRSIVAEKDVPTLYQLAAHSLYKEYIAEKAAMLVGDGENGKSVFLDFLERFLGNENVSHRSLQHLDGNDFAANRLEGKLANFHTDMDDEKVHQLGVFKQLTGRDMFDADVKFEKPIAFRNYATMIFSANRIPAMDEDTRGLWRRWIYLKFPNEFKKGDEEYVEKDELMEQITAEEELQGLLVRCVEEIKAWDDGREFFTHVDSPEQVREKMKRASEPVYNFASVCLERDPENAIPKEDVRRCYREYAREEDLPTIPANQFGEKVVNIRDFPIDTGQPVIDGQQVHAYKGVRFTARGRQVLGLDGAADDAQAAVDDGGPQGWRRTLGAAFRELGGRDEPVERGVVLGYAVANGLSMDQAEHAFEDMKDDGTIYSPADAEPSAFMFTS